MYTIPSQQSKKWVQSNSSEFYGNVSSVRNIDFLKPGYASLSYRTKYVNQSSGSDGFKDVLAIVYNPVSGDYSVVTSDSIHNVSVDLTTVTEDTTTGVPTMSGNGDGLFFLNRLTVSNDSTVKYRSSPTAWTDASIALTTGNAHPLCVFENRVELAVGDGNTVKTYNTSYALQNTLTLPVQYEVRWMRHLNDKLYIGTRDKSNSEALMFVWSGTGTTADGGGFPAYGANWLLSGCRYKSTIVVITNLGQLLEFNGGGFSELDNLPVYYTPYEWFDQGIYDSSVKQRGMIAQGDNILLNISANLISPPYFLENMPAGIWQYAPDVGLHHKYSISHYQSTNDFGANIIDKANALALLVHPVNTSTIPSAANGSGLLVAARTFPSTNVTAIYTLASITTGENRGTIQTSRIYSKEAQDKYQKIWIKYLNVSDAADKILVKYRTGLRNGIPTSNASVASGNVITWTSTTVFTTTSADFANVIAGDEVTILRGSGAGSIAHISTITGSSTYTITLDEAINGVSANDYGIVSVNNWKYVDTTAALSSITSADSEGIKGFSIAMPSRWIQFKLELRGQDVTIEEILVTNNAYKPAV